jgi:hypothetical protein
VPPEPGWRPAVQRHPAPPRRLPDIDHEAVDLAEVRADRFTNALGIAAGVILIIVACVQWRA